MNEKKLNITYFGDGDGSAPIYESMGLGPTRTVEAFVECSDGDLSKPVDSRRFVEALLGHEVDESMMRALFNGSHSGCPNFKVGEDDCPDCIAKQGFK